ncbi:MAG TPA: leucyl aminopeptidase [Bryobacteraceae bacterium]|nr:leucyl aminopeptidase [Bryobacteraceae bacterium]
MQIAIERKPLDQIAAGALIVPVFEGRKESRFGAALLAEGGEVSGKPLEFTLLHHPAGMAAERVLLAGAGKAEKFNSAELRKLIGAAVRHLNGKSIKSAAVALEGDYAADDFASAALEGALLGNFEPDRYKTGNDKKSMDQFTVAAPAGADSLDDAVTRGRILAEAQNFTRELVNEPANRMTPTRMAEAARQMAAEFGLECEVLDRERMEQLGMFSLLGVAQGSAEPPALIVIRYRPAAANGKTHLGLVGKGVTFDTGGISIKPADGMEKMKYDMAGGAAMIGAMRAIAQLKPAIPVTAFVPCVENMPGSRAQRPGDIVTAMSGKTIEVINTDAEGRLILADAMAYARQQGCTHIVDAATLTGAIVVALGHLNVGLFANNDTMRDRVLGAAKAEGERMWPMPLEDDYKDYLKSAFADLANVGGRWGGAITAAIFLREFAENTPWVHLDIAGTAWLDDAKPFLAKGPTGLPVRTLVRLAMDWKD